MRKWTAGMMIAAWVFSATVPAYADQATDLMAALDSMKQQMARMQETIDRQNLRLQQLESKVVLERPQPDTPVTPQPAMTDKDWQKGIKDNIGEAIPWLKGARYGGDFRLRS